MNHPEIKKHKNLQNKSLKQNVRKANVVSNKRTLNIYWQGDAFAERGKSDEQK